MILGLWQRKQSCDSWRHFVSTCISIWGRVLLVAGFIAKTSSINCLPQVRQIEADDIEDNKLNHPVGFRFPTTEQWPKLPSDCSRIRGLYITTHLIPTYIYIKSVLYIIYPYFICYPHFIYYPSYMDYNKPLDPDPKKNMLNMSAKPSTQLRMMPSLR